jgi:polyketide biosynthesis enoyl-CoA hydratase PksH
MKSQDSGVFLIRIANERGEPRLTPKLLGELKAGLERARSHSLVALAGPDTASFCEGMDLNAFAGGAASPEEASRSYAALCEALASFPRPIVALVGKGAAMGGGAGIAACCDVVIAGAGARFGLPEAAVGLIPAVALPWIARRIGVQRATVLAIGAKVLEAQEAAAWGLVDILSDDPEKALEGVAKRIARMDARAVAEIRAMALRLSPPYADREAMDAFARLAASPETRARVARFLAGGTPWEEK